MTLITYRPKAIEIMKEKFRLITSCTQPVFYTMSTLMQL